MSDENDFISTEPETAVPEAAPAAEPVAADPPDTHEEGDEAPPAEKPAEPPLPKGVQRRIDRAVRQKYEAEARAKMLEERLASLEQQSYQRQPAGRLPAEPQEPTLDQFTNFDDYVTAKADYIASRRVQETLAERERVSAAEREAAERTKTATSWQQRVQQTVVELPDFEDVLGASDLPMTGTMQQAIMESDLGPKLAYHLALNPEEAIKIAGMSPLGQVRALGRLEERLETAPKTTPVTQAPAPIKPAGGRNSVTKDPDSMSAEEWVAWRNKQIAAKRA